MLTAIKINNGKEVYISNVVIEGFKIGIDVSRSFVKLRKVKIGNVFAPLLVRDFGCQIVFEDNEGLIVY